MLHTLHYAPHYTGPTLPPHTSLLLHHTARLLALKGGAVTMKMKLTHGPSIPSKGRRTIDEEHGNEIMNRVVTFFEFFAGTQPIIFTPHYCSLLECGVQYNNEKNPVDEPQIAAK